MGHDSLSNASSLDVPSSFDNPSSLDTFIVSSIDAVSSLMCHLFVIPFGDSTGFEDSSCYDDTLKTRIWIIIFFSITLLQMQCYCIRFAFEGVLRSISIGLGVLISLCLISLHLKSCVIYICPLGLQ